MARVTSLADLPARGGPEYAQGLRSAVDAGVRFAIEGIAEGEDASGAPIPEPLITQARRAARAGVGLDTVLRRYVAGHGLLGDFVVQEAEGQVSPAELKRALRGLAATLDCLLAAVTAAYGLEQRRHRRTTEQRRGELVERLLAGEPLDTPELGYELGAQHLGLVGHGPGVREGLPALARSLDARLLAVPRAEEETWAWLARREPLDPAEVCPLVRTSLAGAIVALGEPGEGPSGWRLSHRQARAAFPLARDGPEACIRYADVALLATVVQDDLLTTSLHRLYMEPLAEERDGGETLRKTLRAYFAAEQNVSSAGVALGVDRRTVSSRLRAIEAHIGSSLDECVSDLQVALRLEELGRSRPT
jgi:hypothetical protein